MILTFPFRMRLTWIFFHRLAPLGHFALFSKLSFPIFFCYTIYFSSISLYSDQPHAAAQRSASQPLRHFASSRLATSPLSDVLQPQCVWYTSAKVKLCESSGKAGGLPLLISQVPPAKPGAWKAGNRSKRFLTLRLSRLKAAYRYHLLIKKTKLIFFLLIFYIFAYCFLVSTHCGHIKSSCPKSWRNA